MSDDIATKLSNLIALEDDHRDQAIAWIEENDDLAYHMAAIVIAMDTAWHFTQQRPADEDQNTFRLLGCRMFNSMSAALRLLLGGYFQVSGMVQRDLYETGWLVSYLATHRDKIAVWRDADDHKKREQFTPAAIRKAINERDEFTNDHRSPLYWKLCNLAAHPSHIGFNLLGPPGGAACAGPFMSQEAVALTMEELAPACSVAALQVTTLLGDSPDDRRKILQLYLSSSEWNARFRNAPFTDGDRDALHDLFGAP